MEGGRARIRRLHAPPCASPRASVRPGRLPAARAGRGQDAGQCRGESGEFAPRGRGDDTDRIQATLLGRITRARGAPYTGSLTVNVDPSPGQLVAAMSPPREWMTRWAMARPRPTPWPVSLVE